MPSLDWVQLSASQGSSVSVARSTWTSGAWVRSDTSSAAARAIDVAVVAWRARSGTTPRALRRGPARPTSCRRPERLRAADRRLLRRNPPAIADRQDDDGENPPCSSHELPSRPTYWPTSYPVIYWGFVRVALTRARIRRTGGPICWPPSRARARRIALIVVHARCSRANILCHGVVPCSLHVRCLHIMRYPTLRTVACRRALGEVVPPLYNRLFLRVPMTDISRTPLAARRCITLALPLPSSLP